MVAIALLPEENGPRRRHFDRDRNSDEQRCDRHTEIAAAF
jgi:hypothetical protein